MGEGDDLMTADAGDQDDDQAAERAYEAQRRQPRQQRDMQQRDNQRDNQPRDNQPRDNQRDSQQRDTRPRDNRPRESQGQDGDDGYRQNRPPRRDGRDNGSYEGGQRDSSDRNNQTRRVFAQTRAESEPATIDVSVLPPAFGSDGPLSPIPDLVDMADVTEDSAPKRRGRPKKVAVESDVA